MCRKTFLRASLFGAASAFFWLRLVREARGDESFAPASVQAQLLTRILPFDRGFAGRVGNGNVVVELVQIGGDPDSASAVLHMDRALSDVGTVADRPLSTRTVTFKSPTDLASAARSDGVHVLYLSPGLGAYVPAIGLALVGSGILTFAAVEDFVSLGAVLGVAIAGGKPRISVNLAQARAQKIDFPASVLKLAKVY